MTFAKLLDSFQGLRALVIGDVMLDQYVFGTVDRISPEAPVMVVRKTGELEVPGGAANVAKNIVALGGYADVAGVVGKDDAGRLFLNSVIQIEGLTSQIVASASRPTTCKTRIVANHSHQVLRVDDESTDFLNDKESEDLMAVIQSRIEHANCLILSDYQKGVLTRPIIDQAINLANDLDIPVIVNAKPHSAMSYSGATLMTLNRKEAESVWGATIESLSEATGASQDIRTRANVSCLVITMGDAGMVATWEGGESVARAPQVEAYDVAGAGDTALATLALGVASHGFDPEIFDLAVQTAARVVQHVGVAVPSIDDLVMIRSLG